MLERRGRDLLSRDSVTDLVTALTATNTALWEAESEIRRLDGQSNLNETFLAVARLIPKLNDERARLKKQIDERLGWTSRELKFYDDA